jgi:SNF2 family DNA or RNA helicase
MGQWPQEVQKFLGSTKRVCVLNNMSSFNKLTIRDVQEADIVVVNFTVLCNESYFLRLFRFGGVAPDSLPSGFKGGRHFDAIYDECLKNLPQRVRLLQTKCEDVYRIIETTADENNRRKEPTSEGIHLDRKKTQYKKFTTAKASSSDKTKTGRSRATTVEKGVEKDPWNLSTKQVKKNFENMTCPPLELFYWNRVVIDEFTYLSKQDRSRVQSISHRLQSNFRWCLSGTPPHGNFDDIQSLATLLQVHLGVDDILPFSKLGGRGKRLDPEQTGLENMSMFLELHSMQWHERRHVVAQKFLDRFVRQNIAEIDEIPFQEHIVVVDLTAAERAVYTELETHLKSLDMNSKKALKSKVGSRGDRETRMHKALDGSGCAEEALLKRTSHFDSSSLDDVYAKRERDKMECENELVNDIAAALRQRNRIRVHQPNWTDTNIGEKGEVQDQLELYIRAVDKNESVSGGADDDVHRAIKQLVEKARELAAKDPLKVDAAFAKVNDEKDASADSLEEDTEKDWKRTKGKGQPVASTLARDGRIDPGCLRDMKIDLRNHVHKVRHLGKELCARIRSFRFLESLKRFRNEGKHIECGGGASGRCPYTTGKLELDTIGAFTLCGHIGCLPCLTKHAQSNECIKPGCKAQVQHVHIVPAKDFVEDDVLVPRSPFGSKLSAIVDKVDNLVSNGDRVIVFVQFDDLKQIVADALLAREVLSIQVKGSVQQQVRALGVLQKEKPDKQDPKVILLKMDDETSAGVNLTTCNHAIFVHPLLATTRQEYEAYETQAIGRIRRYGQTKTVHVWRFLARGTIDTDIFTQQSERSLS